jgi:hypothetical protein
LLLLFISYIKARRIVDAPLTRRACVFGFTMIFCRQLKWLNLIYGQWALGRHISLKVGEIIDIGVVLAPVILTMVGIYFA